jgi:hypothetical protein
VRLRNDYAVHSPKTLSSAAPKTQEMRRRDVASRSSDFTATEMRMVERTSPTPRSHGEAIQLLAGTMQCAPRVRRATGLFQRDIAVRCNPLPR